MSFNSRARMGRDHPHRLAVVARQVSIHAPAWGATYIQTIKINEFCFNSRARMGRDSAVIVLLSKSEVSIHAPAWGATDKSTKNEKNKRFQFTRPHGARPVVNPVPQYEYQFQFTRPHGARLTNSVVFDLIAVSIHAPAWGATQFPGRGLDDLLVSIHAPAWGATSRCRLTASPRCFNSRARMGRDTASRLDTATRGFQFTRPHGARRHQEGCKVVITVSIHAPAWGATGYGDVLGRWIGVSIHAPAWGATINPCSRITG